MDFLCHLVLLKILTLLLQGVIAHLVETFFQTCFSRNKLYSVAFHPDLRFPYV